VASIGFQMLGVAVGWQLYELTGSALDLGLVGLVQFVPMILLTLVALDDPLPRAAAAQPLRGVTGRSAGSRYPLR